MDRLLPKASSTVTHEIGEVSESEGSPKADEPVVKEWRPPADSTGDASPVDMIAKLKKLHEAGAISDEEFQESKARFLRRI
jgi:hypothetical protein